MAQQRNYAVGFLIVLLVSLPLLYVGSYFALVEPIAEVYATPQGTQGFVVPHYGWVHSDKIVMFYTPVHAFDRVARRETWTSYAIPD